MSGKGKFRYALQPVLSKRQWDLDALLLDLEQVNSMLAQRREALEKIDVEARAASDDWKRQSESGLIDVGGFSRIARYLQDLAGQRIAREKEILEMEHRHDDLIDRVVAAQRAVDAVEQHRDEKKAEYVRLRLREDFKFADDHWSTLQARIENHDGRS